ncbi:MAG: glycosyltransferase family 2 protein [Acidobacteria bacterium]|nr:glycosyltransferase family 2 protein [Acidobacteriota bacterium]
MGPKDCFVSVVAPLEDDGAIVEGFLTEVVGILAETYSTYEVLLVDDGSQDDTVAKVEGLLERMECIRLIRLSRHYGQEIAISAGLDSVIGDYVVVMLPSSDPPALIPGLVDRARRGADIVFGIRENRPTDSLAVRAVGPLFYWYCRRILRLNLPKNAAVFRVLSRKALNALLQIRDRCRYLPLLSGRVGYTTETFRYVPGNRRGKKTTRDFVDALNLGIDIVTGSSRHPLRFVTWLGTLAGGLNGLYTVYIISIYFFKDQVAEGWTTLSLQSAAMFFFVFCILAVLSEYIGHILAESEQRPLYHVLEERTSSVHTPERRNVVAESVSERR